MWTWLVGCGPEFGLDPIESGAEPAAVAVVTDRFVQDDAPKADVLLVVDDTASMEGELDALSAAFDQLLGALDGVGVDWQVGFTSMDVSDVDAGWLGGEPWILTPGADATLDLPAPTALPPEAGLAAARDALDLAIPGGPNEGFRRAGAGLHVVFVSDGDDASDGLFAGDAVDGFLARLDAEDAATAWAIVGDLPDGCAGPDGAAAAGTRYAAVAEATGGAVGSICAADLGPFVAEVGAAGGVWTARFPLSREPAGAVLVAVDDVALEAGWQIEGREIVFDLAPAPGAEIVVSYVVEVG